MARGKAIGIWMVAAALVISGGCKVSSNTQAFRAEKKFDVSQASQGVKSLAIYWLNGAITFRVDETATEIKAGGTKYASATSQEKADADVEKVDIAFATADSHPSQVSLRCTAPMKGKTNVGADVEVVAPKGVTLNIATRNSKVVVTGNTSLTPVKVDNGKVTMTDNAGAATVEMDNGDVTMTGHTGSATIGLNNGAVAVTAKQGDRSVVVNNGGIQIDSLAGDIKAEANNGTISVRARPPANGTVAVQTSIGEIDLRVPADCAASLKPV